MRGDAKALSSLTVIRDDTCFITLPDPERGGDGASGRRDARRHVRSREADPQVNKVLAARLKESWSVDVGVVRTHVSGCSKLHLQLQEEAL